MLARKIPYTRGPAYPFRFDSVGQVETVDGEAGILASLVRLLSTEPGEEPFLYTNGVPYGLKVSQVLFSDVDTAKAILEFDTRQAIAAWEPRVTVLGVNFTAEKASSGGGYRVNSIITFRYKTTGRVDNAFLTY